MKLFFKQSMPDSLFLSPFLNAIKVSPNLDSNPLLKSSKFKYLIKIMRFKLN